jgi:acyl carrier protein
MDDLDAMIAKVREAAVSLQLTTPEGDLKALDSLAMIDLVTELERTTDVKIPTSALRPGAFQSMHSLASLLVSLNE